MVYHILPEELLLQIEWATLIHLDMTVHLQCILPCKYKLTLNLDCSSHMLLLGTSSTLGTRFPFLVQRK